MKLTTHSAFFDNLLGVSAVALADYRPCYNIVPRQEHFIVTTEHERRKVTAAKWGS
jgi:hypothetical protein